MTTHLAEGDPVPMFVARASNNPKFHFNAAAGRFILLSFVGSMANPRSREVHDAVLRHRAAFDDRRASFFGVTVDPNDEATLEQQVPGIRYFWDTDRGISKLYGAIAPDAAEDGFAYHGFSLMIDPMQRVYVRLSHRNPAEFAERLSAMLSSLPALDEHAGVPVHAPVLIVPRLFEPAFCRELIGLYERHGGEVSGFMREKDGITVPVLDNAFKKRTDYVLTDDALLDTIRQKIVRRLVPEIFKSFQFNATRIERFIVACYDGEQQGFFRPHRDNTLAGTAHRRFAVTVNLNAEDYEGGDLRFPEFGTHTYRAPTGGAVVFSCSLLHEATPVTRGRRFAFLPFLYDDAAAAIRDANRSRIGEEVIDLNRAR